MSECSCNFVVWLSDGKCENSKFVLEMISHLKNDRIYLKSDINFQFRGSKITDTAQSITIKARPAWFTRKSNNTDEIEPVRLDLDSWY